VITLKIVYLAILGKINAGYKIRLSYKINSMAEKKEIDYNQFQEGFKFPAVSHKLDASTVATYLKAVEENNDLYHNTELVPPTAVAAMAFAALSKSISFPPGTIHVSQKLEFKTEANVQDTIICNASISRRRDRGPLHILTIVLSVSNQHGKEILTGNTEFILPDNNGSN